MKDESRDFLVNESNFSGVVKMIVILYRFCLFKKKKKIREIKFLDSLLRNFFYQKQKVVG